MSKFNLKVDEATLLKTYRISSLSPTYVFTAHITDHPHSADFYSQWEDIDHDLTETIAGTLAASSPTGEGDPLGLGRPIECVLIS